MMNKLSKKAGRLFTVLPIYLLIIALGISQAMGWCPGPTEG